MTQWRTSVFLFNCCAVLCLAASEAYAGPVLYTFSGTTLGTAGSPSHSETFQLTLPDFLPVVLNGPVITFLTTDPEVNSCLPCNNPPISALAFLRSAGSDLVQFADQNGTNYPYFFPENTLSNAGAHQTLPGINVNTGSLVITAIPEPSTAGVLVLGLSTIALGLRLRRLAIRHG